MKKNLLASIATAALFSVSAFAADMPVKGPYAARAPAFSWTGCYLGLNGGYGWSKQRLTNSTSGALFNDFTADGGAVGGQIGCDYQFNNNWVIGIQGMWDWSD